MQRNGALYRVWTIFLCVQLWLTDNGTAITLQLCLCHRLIAFSSAHSIWVCHRLLHLFHSSTIARPFLAIPLSRCCLRHPVPLVWYLLPPPQAFHRGWGLYRLRAPTPNPPAHARRSHISTAINLTLAIFGVLRWKRDNYKDYIALSAHSRAVYVTKYVHVNNSHFLEMPLNRSNNELTDWKKNGQTGNEVGRSTKIKTRRVSRESITITIRWADLLAREHFFSDNFLLRRYFVCGVRLILCLFEMKRNIRHTRAHTVYFSSRSTFVLHFSADVIMTKVSHSFCVYCTECGSMARMCVCVWCERHWCLGLILKAIQRLWAQSDKKNV